MTDNSDGEERTAKILSASRADDRYEAFVQHMHSKGLETTREEFEKFEEERRTAITEDELYVSYSQWCVSMSKPIGNRDSFVRMVRGMYPNFFTRPDGKVAYINVKIRNLFG